MIKENFGLYVILTNPVTGYVQCAEAAVKAGVLFLQLRMKDAPFKEILATAKEIHSIAAGSGTQFIVNDDVRIAAESEADGVHLGQDDIPVPEAREFWKEPGKIYGLSTHNEGQVNAAGLVNPDYIGVGPVYTTPTKAVPDPVLGVERMGRLINLTSYPAVAIGGIDTTNIRHVLHAGAKNFCAVRAVMNSPRPFDVIREFQAVWNEFYSNG